MSYCASQVLVLFGMQKPNGMSYSLTNSSCTASVATLATAPDKAARSGSRQQRAMVGAGRAGVAGPAEPSP